MIKEPPHTVRLAVNVAAAWLGNPHTRAGAEDVQAFLARIHASLDSLTSPAQPSHQPAASQPNHIPAVSVHKSLASPEHIVSMIDGKPYKTLRLHLARHGLTPEQYRERYGLKPDYPMVSKNYSQVRRDLARTIGLGRKAGDTGPAAAARDDPEPEQPAKVPPEQPARGRRRKSGADAA